MQNKTYYITTFGCQANIADSEGIAGFLESAGLKKAEKEETADILIFNTCSVRQKAEDRIFGLNKKFKELKNKNPKIKIAITGCVTRHNEKDLKRRLPNVCLFFKSKELWKLKYLTDKIPENFDENTAIALKPKYESSFRANVPISRGCNNFCSYCVVPYARGKEISRNPQEIFSEIKNLAKNKYKEIWLLGQNVNSYNYKFESGKEKSALAGKNFKIIKFLKNKKKLTFPDLLKITNFIPGNFWIRFASPHPKNFSARLIKTMAECKKFPPYVNIPSQSGDNEILRKMNRNYTREEYINLIKKIRLKIPDIAISTDTIVGFPEETDEQFKNTVKLYEEIAFDMAFVSEYSERPGTMAAKIYKDSVSSQKKTERKKILTEILKKSAEINNKLLLNKKQKVLIDEEKNGRFFGRTPGNKVIEITGKKNIKIGEFINVKITKAEPWKLSGKLLKN